MSVDPVLTDANTGNSFNRYAYANNNPYEYIDPDGRNPIAIARRVAKLTEAGIEGVGKLIARRNWRISEKAKIKHESTPGPNGGKVCPSCHNEVEKLDINHKTKWGDTQNKILDQIEKSDGKDMPTREEVRDLYGKDIDGKCATCNRADNKLGGISGVATGASVAGILTEIVSELVGAGDAGAGSDQVPQNTQPNREY